MAGYYTLNVPEIASQRRGSDKQPFHHKKEAFAALSKMFTTPIAGYKGTLLVLPTGGGKTFTSQAPSNRPPVPQRTKVR